ncbi:MAG: hypothetical protein HZA09_06725 [Nitrospirae bacterium]|nr:hypothetical protein [Nitrospirota bacterium]
MTTLAISTFKAKSEKGYESMCPYCNTTANICMASISSLLTDIRRRESYCDSENYDNCPIFLAKSLRRLRRR